MHSTFRAGEPPPVLVEQVADEAGLAPLAARLVAALPRPAFLAISGDLGAGKTTFVKNVAAACGLSFLNYCVRFLRWERYRALLGIRLSRWTSFRIYLSGLALTVTPGKLGEAFRAFLIEREDGTPVARSAPMVLA